VNKSDTPTRNAPTPRNPTLKTNALTAALCATFMTSSAQAAVVFMDIPDTPLGEVGIGPIVDSTIISLFSRTEDTLTEFVNRVDTMGNAVVGAPLEVPGFGTKNFATALDASAMIDANQAYVSNTLFGGEGSIPVILSKGAAQGGAILGDFFDNGTAFIGLRFDLPDTTGFHFGCVGTVTVGSQVTLTTFAYESTPDAGISAGACVAQVGEVPEPGTLALLAMGAAGVLALRRRQRAR
jgi:hypothetical protein